MPRTSRFSRAPRLRSITACWPGPSPGLLRAHYAPATGRARTRRSASGTAHGRWTVWGGAGMDILRTCKRGEASDARRYRGALRRPRPLRISDRRMVTATAARSSSRRLPAGNGSGRAGRPAIPARTRRGRAAPGSRPSAADGDIGSAGVAAEYVLDLHFQDRPAGDDVALVRGCRAEADGGGACPSTGASSPLTRSTGPATGTWRCAGTSQCSTAAARGLGASSVTLSLSQSVKKTSPRWRPRSITRRAEGTASLVSLAIVMASGIGWPAVRAASSHLESWRSGSAPRSVIFTRPVWRPLRTVSDELLPPPPAAPELTGIMAQREVGVEHDPVHAVIGPVQQVPMPLGTSHRPPADRARLIAARQPNCPKGHSFRAKSQTERIGCLGR